jgi:CRISPR/Cas system-associated protein endoribonuclease Cas2
MINNNGKNVIKKNLKKLTDELKSISSIPVSEKSFSSSNIYHGRRRKDS